jgi:hypothetical protein
MVRKMSFEQMQMFIDLFGKSQPLRHQMNHTNSPTGNPLMAIIHLISNADPLEHRPLLVLPVPPLQTFLNFSLALPQYFVV